MNSTKFDQLTEESFQALGTVSRALEALDAVFEMGVDMDAPTTPEMSKILQDLTQDAHNRSEIALESFASSARNALRTIVAIIRRAIEAVIDFLRSEQHSARRCLEDTDKIIAYVGKIPHGTPPSREVTNMAMMMILSYDGHVSRFMTKEIDTFYAKVVGMRKHAPTKEIAAVVAAIRAGNEGTAELDRFHHKLRQGLEAMGTITSVGSSTVYEGADPGRKVYSSERMFGDRFIFGQISDIKDNGFSYSCIVKRDAATRMRLKSFPPIKLSDIPLVAKSIRSFCEDFLMNIDIEQQLYRLGREVNQLERMNGERTGIRALRAVANAMQNVHIVYTRHAMTVTRNMVTYLLESARAYKTP